MKDFEELGMSNQMLDTITKLGFKEPSEIQQKVIPLALKGRDIVGGSATGSGKTLAFSAPILDNIKPNGKILALILTPTRELAEQITSNMITFSGNKKINILSVYGGVNIETQIKKLYNTDIVVGTPGRILDHLARKTLKLDSIKFLVLDEADRMFDMGFQKDVEKIIKQCPENRQTMMFSATISQDIDYLIKKYTTKPAIISVNSYVDPNLLKQVYYDVPDGQKLSLLVHLLKQNNHFLSMVFCNTKRNVDFVTNNLEQLGINAKAIHGGMLQNKRTKILDDFHKKNINVLVCTDVAARGLDIKGVTQVYNYDIPPTSEFYIHRIGRTARAGEDGIAINILSSRDYDNFRNVMKNEFLKITRLELPELEEIRIRRIFNNEYQNMRRSFSRPRTNYRKR